MAESTVEDPVSEVNAPFRQGSPPTQTLTQPETNTNVAKQWERFKFSIELPYLTPDQQETYEAINAPPDEILGEVKEDNVRYVFALFDTIAYRYTYDAAKDRWPDILDEYLTKKDQNLLEPFDPTSSVVHPASRPKRPSIKLKPVENGRKLRKRPPTLRKIASEEPDEDEDTAAFKPRPGNGDSEDDELNYEISDDDFPTRRSKREAAKRGNAKLRQTASGGEPRQTRRSARNRNRVQSSSDEDEDYDDEEEATPIVKKTPRPKLAKPIKPNYGALHSAGYDYDIDVQDSSEAVKRQFVHTQHCSECGEAPAHDQLSYLDSQKGKSTAKQKGRVKSLGGWVQCLRCSLAWHWDCCSSGEKDDMIRAIRAEEGSGKKRQALEEDEVTDFLCGSCLKGSDCMFCFKETVKPIQLAKKTRAETQERANSTNQTNGSNTEPLDKGNEPVGEGTSSSAAPNTRPLVFRCRTCDRSAHYECLPPPPGFLGESEAVIPHYQDNWTCTDCATFNHDVESLLAWRHHPENIPHPAGEKVNYRAYLPREYLVKWRGRGYNRCQWVPHSWLLFKSRPILQNFVDHGSRIPLLEKHISPESAQRSSESSRAGSVSTGLADEDFAPEGETGEASDDVWLASFKADPLAERRIPPGWIRTDRVLDAMFWKPKFKGSKKTKRSQRIRQLVIESDEDSDDAAETSVNEDPELVEQRLAAQDEGIEPDRKFLEDMEERVRRMKGEITEADIEDVAWVYIKWDELPHEYSTWDSPPTKSSKGWTPFQHAFRRFVKAQQVFQSRLEEETMKKRAAMVRKERFQSLEEAPDLGQTPKYKLFPFQLEGLSWLYGQWTQQRSCILADEMGLGKTIQMASLVGYLFQKWQATPSLIVVPKSTVINWVREFERWAPELTVVPFFGDKDSKKIILDYEAFHSPAPKKFSKIKFHVLITTYESVTNGSLSPILTAVDRWELLVVDEGQKLKNDHSKIFRDLKKTKTFQRIIMTGTPLNNKIRELFTLMNFLDEVEWADLDKLEKDHLELTEHSLALLHERLKPYFLRRLKIDVLDLPPKNEVIVPVSMTPIQREVYRSVLSNSMDAITSLIRSNDAGKKATMTKKGLNNTLMQLRKCLQHPYLIDRGLEKQGLSPAETKKHLVDASAKLRLLQTLLPKLRERGHRVLLFSQFKMALDIIDDFLFLEGYKFLRLDGDTPHNERQKGMDEFNKPNSEYFIYLLTTRAGGVGINLSSADTVIIFDPDFNPHQDLQAIARSYRYGLQRTCLVFKLMVRQSAEEKIMELAKKKLVLDHLIVQKMDDENPSEELQSILTHGAQALFESGEDKQLPDITYSDVDINKLIDRTETEVPSDQKDPSSRRDGLKFDYAKLWVSDGNSMEEIKETDDVNGDSWAEILAKAKEQMSQQLISEKLGRGIRRRAAVQSAAQTKIMQETLMSPEKKGKSRKKSADEKSVDTDFSPFDAKSVISDDNDSDYAGPSALMADMMDLDLPATLMRSTNPLPPAISVTSSQSMPVRSAQPHLGGDQFIPYLPPIYPVGHPRPPVAHGLETIPRISHHTSLQAIPAAYLPAHIPPKKRPSPSDDPSGAQRSAKSERVHKKPKISSHLAENNAAIRVVNRAEVVPTDTTQCSFCQGGHEEGACLVQQEKDLGMYRERILEETGDETAEEKQQALKLIDKKIRRIQKKLSQVNRPSLTQPSQPTKGQPVHSMMARSTSANFESQKNTMLQNPSLVASSSKSSTPSVRQRNSSTPGAQSSSACEVCERPWHPIRQCPFVLAGPDSLKQVINRLEHNPDKFGIVALLRTIRKERKKELGLA